MPPPHDGLYLTVLRAFPRAYGHPSEPGRGSSLRRPSPARMGHPMQRFQSPAAGLSPRTRGFTLLMTTPTPVATPFSARTKIHLYHPSTAAFNVTSLHAHGDSSHQCQNRCTHINLSPHARASVRALHGRVLKPFFPNTQIHTPLPRLTAKPVHLFPRTCKAYPALCTDQLS